jgi:hypothetical protein
MGDKTAQRLPAPPVGGADLPASRTQRRQHAPYRDTASFGKRSEFIAMAERFRRGFDVHATLVDDQGIDRIVRLDSGRYVDLQIKARSEGAKQATCAPT